MSIRMFVGRDSEVPGGHPREEFFDKIALLTQRRATRTVPLTEE